MDLVAYSKERMKPMLPIPTALKPRLGKANGTRVVAFDLYGTLLVSAAGDITAEGGLTARRAAMDRVLKHVGGDSSDVLLSSMCVGFVRLQEEGHHLRRREGVHHSEFDIRNVWRQLFIDHGNAPLTDGQIEEVALIYECEVNPVWEMPGASSVLQILKKRGVILGVVSNAQSYTKMVFEGVVGSSLSEFGIEPSMSVFSFELGEGKPSTRLYEMLSSAIREKGIEPNEVLYIGNDMRKDILPARETGFRTALFAGDKRSLRFGDCTETEAMSIPDFVITELTQLLEIV